MERVYDDEALTTHIQRLSVCIIMNPVRNAVSSIVEGYVSYD